MALCPTVGTGHAGASRRARGVATWAALRSLGRAGVADLVERCCTLAASFADLVRDEPGVEVLNDVVLNQVVVRFDDSDAPVRWSTPSSGREPVGRRLDLARQGGHALVCGELVDHRGGHRPVGGCRPHGPPPPARPGQARITNHRPPGEKKWDAPVTGTTDVVHLEGK